MLILTEGNWRKSVQKIKLGRKLPMLVYKYVHHPLTTLKKKTNFKNKKIPNKIVLREVLKSYRCSN